MKILWFRKLYQKSFYKLVPKSSQTCRMYIKHYYRGERWDPISFFSLSSIAVTPQWNVYHSFFSPVFGNFHYIPCIHKIIISYHLFLWISILKLLETICWCVLFPSCFKVFLVIAKNETLDTTFIEIQFTPWIYYQIF